MILFRQLILVEAAALLALLIVALGMSGYGAIDSMLHANSLLDPLASVKIVFAYTVILGILPVVVIGAPAYLALHRYNRARWLYVLLLGMAPGLVAFLFETWTGFLAVVCGAAVATLTHLMCRRLGPNSSFNPTYLRGT